IWIWLNSFIPLRRATWGKPPLGGHCANPQGPLLHLACPLALRAQHASYHLVDLQIAGDSTKRRVEAPRPMSVLGHKQTFCDARVMSASTRKQTFASVTSMSALCQKRTSPCQRATWPVDIFPLPEGLRQKLCPRHGAILTLVMARKAGKPTGILAPTG